MEIDMEKLLDYGIDERLYRKIEQAKNRDEILEVFKREKYRITPQRIFQYCFYYAFEQKHDQEAAKKILEIFHDDLDQSMIGIISLVKSTIALQGYPDMTIDDVIDLNGMKYLAFGDKLVWDIHYRSKHNDPVLIIGESGTGKEGLARLIHDIGPRRNRKFLDINCAAIPENLLESELFGHKKGSFTGAVDNKDGILKVADQGTVFLDELGKMPKYLQAKILKVIEQKEFIPIGDRRTIKIDVMFIAAAQPKDAREIIPDLLNRLGFPDCIELPTLEQRLKGPKEVGQWIIGNSLKRVKDGLGVKDDVKISEKAYQQLLEHKYPGNFRELENILKSALKAMEYDRRTEIQVKDLVNIFRKSNIFYKEDETSEPKNIPLKNLFDYADKIKAGIIEAKIKSEMQKTGLDLKSLCEKEGIEYYNFRKKIVTTTGRGIRDFTV